MLNNIIFVLSSYLLYKLNDNNIKINKDFCCFSAKDNNNFCNTYIYTCWTSAKTNNSSCGLSYTDCISCSNTAIWCNNTN